MFKLFEKKTQTPATPAPFFGHRRGRGTAGNAFHIIKDENWNALCGIDVVERKSEVTPKSVRAALPLDHKGFYHCADCVTELLK